MRATGQGMRLVSVFSTALLAVAAVPGMLRATTYDFNTTISGPVSDSGVRIINNATVTVAAGGTWTASGNFYINDGGGPNATVNVAGGALNYTGGGGDGFQVGWWFGGYFNISAGSATLANMEIYSGYVTVSGSGTLNITGRDVLFSRDGGQPSYLTISGGTANLRGLRSQNTGTASTKLVLSAGELSLGAGGIYNTGGAGNEVELVFTGGTLKLSNNGPIAVPLSSDTVNALFIDGVQQAAGTWGKTGSGADHINDTYFTGSGVLTVLPLGRPPTARFTATPTNGFAPLAVEFANSSATDGGAITNCFWDFGDATTTNTAAVSNLAHTFSSAGTYSVTLVVSSDAGGSSSASQTVVVATVPVPDFEAGRAIRLDKDGGHASLTLEATEGLRYRVVCKDDLLAAGEWRAVMPPEPDGWTNGAGPTITLTDTNAAGVQHRFYRIEAKSVDAP